MKSVLSPYTCSDLQKSGLSDDTQQAMGVKSLTRLELAELLERNDFDSDEEGYVIPYLDLYGHETGQFNVRLKFGIPDRDNSGKRLKYCRKAGSKTSLYFPPGLEALLKTNEYVIVTEGEKKAAKAVQEGFPCVAIAGVNNWADPVARDIEKREGLKATYRTPPLKELQDLANNRKNPDQSKKILLVFDSDVASNRNVQLALHLLSDALLWHTNGWVKTQFIPSDSCVSKDKVGLDDWLSEPSSPAAVRDWVKMALADRSNAMAALIRFPYAKASENNSNKNDLCYIVPNMPRDSKWNVHRVIKQTEVLNDNQQLVTVNKVECNTRVWLNRVLHDIDDDSTLYEMAYILLSGSDIRYFSGGAELITLSAKGAAEIYASKGAPILSKERPAMEEFFHSCQVSGVRANEVRTVDGTKRRGWITYNDKLYYVLGGRILDKNNTYASQTRNSPFIPIEQNDGPLREALKPRGSFEVWKSAMLQYVIPNPLPALYVSAALGGLLREWCPESENFIVHLYAESSAGKTMALHTAAGLWGNPARLKDAWRSTDNGLESRCVARNDMNLFLDEAGMATDDVIKNSIYMVGNGNEKLRATRDGSERKPRMFRILALSTGERALLSGNRNAGQEVRVLEIPARVSGVFWDNTIHSAKEAEHFEEIIKANYGFAADLAVRAILGAEETKPGYWKDMHDRFSDNLRLTMPSDTPPHLLRRAKHPALMLTCYFILLKGVLELSDAEVSSRMKEAQAFAAKHLLMMSSDQFSGGEKTGMLEHFLSSVASNQVQHFHSRDNPARGEAWGMIQEDGAMAEGVAVIPAKWPELCKPFDGGRILGMLDGLGALIYKARKDKKTNIRINQHVVSCYYVDLNKVREWLSNPDESTTAVGVTHAVGSIEPGDAGGAE